MLVGGLIRGWIQSFHYHPPEDDMSVPRRLRRHVGSSRLGLGRRQIGKLEPVLGRRWKTG
jgi:hypothetical protein